MKRLFVLHGLFTLKMRYVFFGTKHFKSGEIDLYPIYVSILLVGMTSKGNVPSLHVFLKLSRSSCYKYCF